MELNEQNLKIAFEYLNRKAALAIVNENELAKRMGIDPDKDLLIVPMEYLTKWHFFAVHKKMPSWASITGASKEFKLIKGARHEPK